MSSTPLAVHPYEPHESITQVRVLWVLISDCFNFQSCLPTQWLEMPWWLSSFSIALLKDTLYQACLRRLVLAERGRRLKEALLHVNLFLQLPIQFSLVSIQFSVHYYISAFLLAASLVDLCSFPFIRFFLIERSDLREVAQLHSVS